MGGIIIYWVLQEVIGNNLPGFQKTWALSRPVQRENILTHAEFMRISQTWQNFLFQVRHT